MTQSAIQIDSLPMSAADRAYAAIRERLVLLEIPPNAPIDDDRLAAEIGTGRTPVREALKRLERDRLVVAYPRRGTFATPVDITDLADISEIRLILEPTAAMRAARTASPDARAELTAIVDEIRCLSADDGPDWLAADTRAHSAIYRAAGNRHLEDILMVQGAHATRIWSVFRDRIPSMADHVTEHIELLEAIVRGDADIAAALSRRHVEEFEELIRRLL